MPVRRLRTKRTGRLEFEIRELIAAGLVRPRELPERQHHRFQQIAQARVAYGGRGQISDVLQPALRANR